MVLRFSEASDPEPMRSDGQHRQITRAVAGDEVGVAPEAVKDGGTAESRRVSAALFHAIFVEIGQALFGMSPEAARALKVKRTALN